MKKLLAIIALCVVGLSYADIHRTHPVRIGYSESDGDGNPTLTKVCVDGYAYLVLNVGEYRNASGDIIQMRKAINDDEVKEALIRCYLNNEGKLVFE